MVTARAAGLVAVETLGEMLDLSWRVHARCAWGNRDGMKSIRRCAFSCELDLQTLVLTRGRAFPMGDLASRLRCPRCGSRKMSVAFSPPTNVNRKAVG